MKSPYIICVIDDDDIYQFTITRTIKSTNLAQEIQVFNDGEQAIKYFQELPESSNLLPDVIFVDINMPMMNGWEFVEQFKSIKNKFCKDIKIYMSSSSIDIRDIEKAQQIEEIADYLVKPMSINKIKDIIGELG